MTVRELRESLEGCNDDATTYIGTRPIDTFEWLPEVNQVFIGTTAQGNCVVCGARFLPGERVRPRGGYECEMCSSLPTVKLVDATPSWARATNCAICGSTLLPNEKVRSVGDGFLCETCLPEGC